jgi:2-polyprenyl-3-methyl-5-hydroxy-6-metoxy-1,4-benzoquinol methylase
VADITLKRTISAAKVGATKNLTKPNLKGKLIFLDASKKVKNVISEFVNREFKGRSGVRILEAGCGNKWDIKVKGFEYIITGVDVDQEALQLRKNIKMDLDEIIVGDLRTVKMPKSEYNLLYNSFVLEHIDGAEGVLDNFRDWLKPGGVMILKIPDRNTVYGFLTRMTPYNFHVLVKKYIYGQQNAGKPGYGPYPTYHDEIISREGIFDYCNKNGLTIEEEYVSSYYLQMGWKGFLIRPALKVLELLSFGKLTAKYNNLTYMIRK